MTIRTRSTLRRVCAALAALCASAAFAASSYDYVQDGLMAHWDGVENVGFGLHDDSPSAWIDLVGSLEITIPAWVTAESNGFYSVSSTDTRTYPAVSISGLGDNVTIEVVAERVQWRKKDNYKNLQRIMCSPYAKFGYRENSTAGVYFQLPVATDNKLWLYTSTSGSFDVSKCHTYTARVTMPKDASNTLLVDAATVPGWVKEGNDGMPGDPPANWEFFSASRADIRLHAVRVYNRLLTDAEVEANAAIDHLRFVEGDVSGSGLLSAMENVSTNGADVVWSLVSLAEAIPSVTARFVSGFESDFSDGVVRELGTFPGSTVVTSAVSFARSTTTYWRFEAEDSNGRTYISPTRVVPAFALDSGSYAASGLVAQWDGIENAGRGVHSDSPAVWKDLVGSSDITVPSWVSASGNGMVSVGSSEARTYPEFASLPGLDGDDVTIEVAARRVRWTQTDDYGNLQTFLSSPWGNFGYRFNNNTTFYAALPPNGTATGEARLYDVNTSGTGGAKATEYQTMAGRITRNSSTARNEFLINAAAQTLNFAGYTFTMPDTWRFFNNPRTEIEFYAIRIYNRRLTDSELAGNAWIDRLRVTGEVTDNTAAPLQIAYDGAGASVRKGYYCWPVPGETFSYQVEHAVRDGDYQSVCVGWTLYAETGADVWTEEAGGTACEASYLPDARRHRLVFHTVRSRDFPDGYVRLDSLVANGSQMIDTGYHPNYQTYCAIDLKFTGNTFYNTRKTTPMGAPPTADGLIFSFNFGGSAGEGSTLYFWTRYNYATGGDGEICRMSLPMDTVKNRNFLYINMPAGGAQYGDALIGIKQRTAEQTQQTTFRLFGSADPFSAYEAMTIYSAKLGDRVGGDTTFLRDFVPARSLETGRRGFYDYVTGDFFTNMVANAAEDFSGAATGLHIEGEPSRIGEPTIPYGHSLIEDGVAFEIAETNTVRTADGIMHLKAISRYTYDDATGAWSLAERTRGASVTDTYSGVPVKYLLEWGRQEGLVLYLR